MSSRGWTFVVVLIWIGGKSGYSGKTSTTRCTSVAPSDGVGAAKK